MLVAIAMSASACPCEGTYVHDTAGRDTGGQDTDGPSP
jgi:hypothetical protein